MGIKGSWSRVKDGETFRREVERIFKKKKPRNTRTPRKEKN